MLRDSRKGKWDVASRAAWGSRALRMIAPVVFLFLEESFWGGLHSQRCLMLKIPSGAQLASRWSQSPQQSSVMIFEPRLQLFENSQKKRFKYSYQLRPVELNVFDLFAHHQLWDIHMYYMLEHWGLLSLEVFRLEVKVKASVFKFVFKCTL